MPPDNTLLSKMQGMMFQLEFEDSAKKTVMNKYYENPERTYKKIGEQYLAHLGLR